MSGPDQEKFGVKSTVFSLDTISAIPIKKRRFVYSRTPSPPPKAHSSLTVGCDKTQNKCFSSVQTPSLEASDSLTCLTASSDEGSSRESGFNIFLNEDTSDACKHQVPFEHDCNEKLQSMASLLIEGKNRLKDAVSSDKLDSLKGIEQHSASFGPVDVPMEEEILDMKNLSNQTSAARCFSENTVLQFKETLEKVHISDSRSFRQAHLKMQDLSSRREYVQDPPKKCYTSRPNTDSAQSCLDRFKWDLNTTMDTWDESMNDLAPNNGSDEHGRSDFGGLLGRLPEQNLMDSSEIYKKSNAFPPSSGELKSLSSDHFLGLCSSPKSVGVCFNSETEACLDLRLKPSLMSESYLTLGNFDSLKETQFLSLATVPSSFSADQRSSVCGIVKSEPYHGCTQLEERKTEIIGSEASSLKPIKSEPCEIGEASKITIPGVAQSASDAAIKLEPVLDKSQDCVASKETGLSQMSDHLFPQSSQTFIEAIGNDIMHSNTKSDSFIKDVKMRKLGEYLHLHKYEVDNMDLVMQNEVNSNHKICHSTMSVADSISHSEKGIFCEPKSLVMEPLVGRELISIKQPSNEGSEDTDLFIKSEVEGQIMSPGTLVDTEACEQSHIAAESLCESLNSGTLVERIIGGMSKIDSYMSSSETDSNIATVVETNANCDVLKFNQTMNPSIYMIEKQDDNDCMTARPHVTDGMMHVHEKGVFDDRGFEDGEVKDRALHDANGDSHLKVDIKKIDSYCRRDIADIPVEMSKDPGTVECVNSIDPATAADLQESSSVTGDSNRMKTIKTIRKKDRVSEWKTKSERDPTLRVASIENNTDGSTKSSVPFSGRESIKDSIDRGSTGRIINLNSASSRKMKLIHEKPLSSRVERENPADKLFKVGKSHSRYSSDEIPVEKSCKIENVKRRGLACGNHGQLRFRDKHRPNQFPNYIRGQINGTDTCVGRISRKVTNELQNRSHMSVRDQGEMMDPLRGHPLSQYERTDARRERLSLSPIHRCRGPPHLTPPMSPSHWPPHSSSEDFNGQPEMEQCRAMQESMRSSRRQHYAEEMMSRRRGTAAFGARLLPDDGMMECAGREFHRKNQRLDMNEPRQVPGEYYRTQFGHGQIHQLDVVDGNVPGRYRQQRCIVGDDAENFSFHNEQGPPPRSYRYHPPEDNQGREFQGRFKNRLGNTSTRYRHIEQQQQHEDDFRHEQGQGWNNSGYNNIRPKRRY